jgi:hypothetical protein
MGDTGMTIRFRQWYRSGMLRDSEFVDFVAVSKGAAVFYYLLLLGWKYFHKGYSAIGEWGVAFFIFFSMAVILAISFSVIKRNLHPFEILFIWMVVIIINHNLITIAAVNKGRIEFANDPVNYWTLVFNRVFLLPLLIVFYFDRMVVKGPYQKWIWLPVGISILTGFEYLVQVFDVYTIKGWNIWWSVIEWLGIFLLVHFPWLWYRNLLRKELQ